MLCIFCKNNSLITFGMHHVVGLLVPFLHSAGESRNTSSFGITIYVGLVAIIIIMFVMVIFIMGLLIWKRRQAGHPAQPNPVQLEMGSLDNRTNEPNQQMVTSLMTSYSICRSDLEPGEVAGEISEPLLENSSSSSENQKPDKLQSHPLASDTVVHIESSLAPLDSPNRDRLRHEELSEARSFQAPAVQPILSTSS